MNADTAAKLFNYMKFMSFRMLLGPRVERVCVLMHGMIADTGNHAIAANVIHESHTQTR